MPDISNLIAAGECEWIDFKLIHHANKADLLHDVLCLANADHNGDRYLVFGIRDVDHAVVGVESDIGRRSSADVVNFFQSLRLNQSPSLKLVTVQHDQHEIDILTIKNLPEKPYFLLREYVEGGERVRAGSIYLRLGDTNTPKDRTADDVRVERMYRQRFGIDLSPADRVRIYLRDVQNWKVGHLRGGRMFFRYEPFPEFTLIESSEQQNQAFDEPWVRVFPDSRATRDVYYLKYHGTVLDKIYLVWCDGARYVTVLPRSWNNGLHEEGGLRQSFYFVVGSLDYLVNSMIQRVYPVESRLYIQDGISFFDSVEEARRMLAEDLGAGVREYTFYRFDSATRTYLQIRNGQERRLAER